ncbi:MAG: hypothetical protein ABR562_02405 [Thermoplasmatota archaeon]
MLLQDGNKRVELTILGYEFPAAKEKWDANWLVVHGDIVAPEGAWSFDEPVWLTNDPPRLADWLEAVAMGRPEVAGRPRDEATAELRNPWEVAEGFGTMEPNLAFLLYKPGPGTVELGVQLDYESRPPWRIEASSDNPYVLRLRLSAETVLAAAEALRKEIAPYPPRLDF